MNIKVEKTVYLELDKKEVGLFSVMLQLAMKRLKDWKNSSQDQQFRMIGEEVTSFEEEQMFIEDLMRGINK